MYLQGQLQHMFDALYQLGVIDPVLKKDWQKAMTELPQYLDDVHKAIKVLNKNLALDGLVAELKGFSPVILEYLAMEVAREFADFHARDNLH